MSLFIDNVKMVTDKYKQIVTKKTQKARFTTLFMTDGKMPYLQDFQISDALPFSILV